MTTGFRDDSTARRVVHDAQEFERQAFRLNGTAETYPVIPLVRLPPDGGIGRPANEYHWNDQTKAFEKFSDATVRVVDHTIGVFVGYTPEGVPIYASGDVEDYPDDYYGSGPYAGGPGGSIVTFDAWMRVECVDGKIVQDRVRYTVVSVPRGRQSYLSISMTVVDEDVEVLQTECDDVLKDVDVSSAACDEDGNITITLDKEFVTKRFLVCGECETEEEPPP